jgi:hypothetical protein
MHDGASAHFTRDVKQFLDSHYPDRWIGQNRLMLWPLWSPDLNRPTSTWGHLKGIVYTKSVNMHDELWHFSSIHVLFFAMF